MPLLSTYGESLLQTHRTLLLDLQTLLKAFRTCPPDDCLACLDHTRTHLVEHFHFEEQNGYLDAVLARQPHLERAIDRLAREHGQLLRSLDRLREEVQTAAVISDDLRERVRRWVQEVRHHEQSENILVQDAFNLDLMEED